MYTKNPEYFLTVAREGSISRAAEKLYLSQPYLSQCIGRLEQELQMKLFDRSHTPLVLTDAGRLYLSYLEGVGNLTGKFESQIEELRTGSRQILNVGMTPWRGSVLLPDILPAYAAAFQVPVESFIEMGTAINPAINSLFRFCLLAVGPFNLVKGLLTAAITLMIYKKISILLKGNL